MSTILALCLTDWDDHTCELDAGHLGAHVCECDDCDQALAA